jgi:maltose/maltodextrin transport system substrate-binding protein
MKIYGQYGSNSCSLILGSFKTFSAPMNRLLWILLALCLVPANLFAWTSGELLIWMDNERGRALQPIVNKFEADLGVKVLVETPENITENFSIAAQAGEGPDLVIWTHDKVGEWAAGGLIAPVTPTGKFTDKFFPKSWNAVTYNQVTWGYPIALETVTLIYNKALFDGPPPVQLSQLAPIDRAMKRSHPGVITILWNPQSAYYTWGILASGGGFVFEKRGTDYDEKNIGVATPGAVAALSEIIGLIRIGILPKVCSYGETEDLMGQGKLAMTIAGPWAWSNLIQKGIDFDLAQIPGVDGNVGRPFVGVSMVYLNRLSPNQDLMKEFVERYMLTDDGLATMNKSKPIGIPALISLYEKMAANDPHLRELKASVDIGQVMPNIPQMGRFFTSLRAALRLAVDGKLTAGAALQQAEASIRR